MKSCSLCGQLTDPWVRSALPNLSARVQRVLRMTQPRWQPGHIVCPQCALDTLEYARREDRRRSVTLQAELNLPFPVQSADYACGQTPATPAEG